MLSTFSLTIGLYGALLTVAIDYTPRWHVDLTYANREYYCKLHGYVNHFIKNYTFNLELAPHTRALYAKVAEMESILPRYSWVLWTDLDVFILDVMRPVEALIPEGFDIRIPGEMMTKYVQRFQFSNMIYWIRNSRIGREFTRAHLHNITLLLQHCTTRLCDQMSQRSALAHVIFKDRNLTNPCKFDHNWKCDMYIPCLDQSLIRRYGLRKGIASPHPVYFDDISRYDTGLCLQTKQSVWQWYNNLDDRRHMWLPLLQRALLRSFSVHWVMNNPFDWDNYIDYYYRHNKRYRLHTSVYLNNVYKRPQGCVSGDGSTKACCGYYNGYKRTQCARYGKRMGDW